MSLHGCWEGISNGEQRESVENILKAGNTHKGRDLSGDNADSGAGHETRYSCDNYK